MGGKTRINAANRNINHGEAVINGTKHNISRGRTRIGGTSQTISFDTVKPGDSWTIDLSKYTGTKCGTVYVSDWTCPATGYYDIELHGGGGAGQACTHSIGQAQGAPTVFYAQWSGGGSGEIWKKEHLTKGQVLQVYIGDGGHATFYNASSFTPEDKTGHKYIGSPSYIIDKSTGQKKWQVDGGGHDTSTRTNIGPYSDIFSVARAQKPSGDGWSLQTKNRQQLTELLGKEPEGDGGFRDTYYVWIQTETIGPAAAGSLAEYGTKSTASGPIGSFSGTFATGGLGNKNKTSQTYGNGGHAEGYPGVIPKDAVPGHHGGCIITFVSK